jgi:adenosylmethionine-8-amino-7-oxononanoate aminotransferase
MTAATQHFREHPHVADVRQHGMILAIELVKDKVKRIPYPWQERRGLRIYQYGLAHGALLRPLGNVVYFMPPYVITTEQIDRLADITWNAIGHAVAD